MTEFVSLIYELGEHGWSSFTLTIGAKSLKVGPFGYCTDALGDLVRAALIIATSGDNAEAMLDGEPVEWRLIVERVHGLGFESTDIHIAVTRSLSGNASQRQTVFESITKADLFALAVLQCAQAIWDEHGNEGYDRKWGGPRGFPLRALTALKAAVSVSDPRLSE